MATVGVTGYKALHEAHAIEVVVASVRFSSRLTDDDFKVAVDFATKFESVLQGRENISAMEFAVSPHGVTQFPMQENVVPHGITLFRADTSGVHVEELRIDRDAITFVTQLYKGWPDFLSSIKSYVFAVADKLVSLSSGDFIQSYGLVYVNKFIQIPGVSSAGGGLIRNPSDFVNAYIHDAEDMWHSHSGKFIRLNDVVKRLVTVRIDCLDETAVLSGVNSQTRRVVRVENAVTDIYGQLGYSSRLSGEYSFESEFLERFEGLHAEQRLIIAEIISESMLVNIGAKS